MIELIIAPATEQSVSKLALFPHHTAGTYNRCYRQVPTYHPVQTQVLTTSHMHVKLALYNTTVVYFFYLNKNEPGYCYSYTLPW